MGISRACVFDGWSRASILLTSTPFKANILVDQAGQARLADFGLVTIISDCPSLLSSSSHTQGGTARWMSPELIDPQRFGVEQSCRTKSSDCYALGMVVYETISGRPPFHQHADLTVVMKVLEGERPTRGAGFAGSLWHMLTLCWAPQPDNRPTIEDVFQCLKEVETLLKTPSPEVDEDMGSNGDDGDTSDGSPRMFFLFGSCPLQPSAVSVRSVMVDIPVPVNGDLPSESLSHTNTDSPVPSHLHTAATNRMAVPSDTWQADQIAYHFYTKLVLVVNDARLPQKPDERAEIDKWVSISAASQPLRTFHAHSCAHAYLLCQFNLEIPEFNLFRENIHL
jgi:serine/threonine protein kinase